MGIMRITGSPKTTASLQRWTQMTTIALEATEDTIRSSMKIYFNKFNDIPISPLNHLGFKVHLFTISYENLEKDNFLEMPYYWKHECMITASKTYLPALPCIFSPSSNSCNFPPFYPFLLTWCIEPCNGSSLALIYTFGSSRKIQD